MQCPFCKETVADDAIVCPHCRRDQPAEIERKAKKRRSIIFWIVGVPLVLFVGFMIIGIMAGPETYGDIAASGKESCIRNNGDGAWTASLGISLEKFCEGVGNFKALQQERSDHPERF
jgi:hypothetical protein